VRLTAQGGPGQLNPSNMLLISNPYLSLCFAVKGTGYGAKRTAKCQGLKPAMRGSVLAHSKNLAAGRVIPDCHFSVQLNHFIPVFLSYSVDVLLK
jgi:hypothetical protein